MAASDRYLAYLEAEGRMITRWDNAPHYRQLDTFPHHQPIGDRILPSDEMSAAMALARPETMM